MMSEEAEEVVETRTTARRQRAAAASQQPPTPTAPEGGGGWGFGSMWSAVAEAGAGLADKMIDAIDSVEDSIGAGRTPAPGGTLADRLREAQEVNKDKDIVRVSGRDREDEQATAEELDVGTLFGSALDSLKEASTSALETVGKTAFEVMDGGRPKIRSTSSQEEMWRAATQQGGAAGGGGPHQGPGDAAPLASFAAFFEENHGREHYEALGLLSSSHAAEASTLLREAGPEHRVALSAKVQEIATLLAAADDEDEEEEEGGEGVDGDESGDLNSSHSSSDEQTAERRESFARCMGDFASFAGPIAMDVPDMFGEKQQAILAWVDQCRRYNAQLQTAYHNLEEARAAGEEIGDESDAIPRSDAYGPQAIHDTALEALADFTASFVEILRRAAEHMSVEHPPPDNDAAESPDPEAHVARARSLRAVSAQIVKEVAAVTSSFVEVLQEQADLDKLADLDPTELMTNLFVEGSAASSYAQDATQLFAPLLHVAFLTGKAAHS